MRARLALDLTIGCVAIGWAAIFFRLAADVHPLVSSALRLSIAGLALSPLVARALRDGRLPPTARRAALLGGLLYAVHFGTWVASLGETSVAASVTLVTATPVLLAAIGLARRRDRPDGRTLAAIAVASLGAAIIGASDALAAPGAVVGDLLALAGAVAMALYLLLARELGPGLEPFAYSGLCAAIGGAALWLLVPALDAESLAMPSAGSLFWIALSALVPQVIGHSLLTRALRDATPTAVGLATTSEPVLSTALAFAILGERPAPAVLAGCAVVLAGVAFGLSRPAPAQAGGAAAR